MNEGAGWSAYGRQSYRLQFADGVQWRRRGARPSPSRRLLMRPGQLGGVLARLEHGQRAHLVVSC